MSRVKVTREQMKALGLPGYSAWERGKGKPVKKVDNSATQALFLAACKAHRLPVPLPEYRFAPERLWRFDWLFDGWLALEVQGGIWTQGRHVRGKALLAEHEKLNEAVCHGYSVLFCTPRDIETGAIFPTIKRALVAKGAGG